MTRIEIFNEILNIVGWTESRDGSYESLEDALDNIQEISNELLKKLDGTYNG